MKKDEETKRGTTVYLSPRINKTVKDVAKKEDRSFTKQIERMLKDWLIERGYLDKE
ncbi:MAG: hypothetical protein OEV42_03555 [Deltaproteobacteria bacterium]|nr:hypothetical protein [Deltaproteobacteria bacterium]